MNRCIAFFILIILIVQTAMMFIPSSANAAATPMAQQGKIDLQGKPLNQIGSFKLVGEWEFYWDEFVEPGALSDTRPTVVSVPDTWRNYRHHGEQLPKEGYATYHLTILLDEQDIGEVVAFYMPSIATAYHFWVNDLSVAANGKAGTAQAATIPRDRPQVVTVQAEQKQLQLTLQVANFHQRKAGLWEPVRFGTVDQITGYQNRKQALEAFVIGCIFIIGFYHLVMFFLRPSTIPLLYFAIACFSIGLRTMLLDDKLIHIVLADFNWELSVKLEYIAALTALIFFALFMQATFLVDQCNRSIRFIISFIVLYMTFIIFVPARIFTNTFMLFQLLVIGTMLYIVMLTIRGMVRKKQGAFLNFIALLIIFTAVLNDLFYNSNHISTNEFVSVGFLFFLFIQAIHLAREYTNSFNENAKLSMELKRLTESLESQIKKRTTELRDANQNLKQMEKARRRLFASVSHELNTPLTFIQGYVKAMLDGVVPKDDSTYLRAVHSDTQMMAKLIEDLQELSKLESGQIIYQFTDVDMEAFITKICEEQQPIMLKSGYAFSYDNIINPADRPLICTIDTFRLKQTVLNLFVNAIKFTKPGGFIRVQLEVAHQHVKVSVSDNGKGIDEKNIPYIFDQFYRETRSEYQGAGLGLAIAKEIIEHHQGKVGVRSEKHVGSTFFFMIPLKIK